MSPGSDEKTLCGRATPEDAARRRYESARLSGTTGRSRAETPEEPPADAPRSRLSAGPASPGSPLRTPSGCGSHRPPHGSARKTRWKPGCRPWTVSPEAVLPQAVFGDHLLQDLGCTLDDLQGFGFAEQTLDRILVDAPVASVHLDRIPRHLHRHPAGEVFGDDRHRHRRHL